MAPLFKTPLTLLHKVLRGKNTSWHSEVDHLCAKLHLPSVANIIDVILFRGNTFVWEPKISKFLHEGKGDLFVDVGACYGRITLLVAGNYKRVLAIEPDPRNVKTLSANVTYSHAKNITILPIAISDKDGIGMLYMNDDAGWSGVVTATDGVTGDIPIKTCTIASLLGNEKVDIIKVDVQGHEWQLLEGAVPVIGNIKSWLVELHNLKRKNELESWFTGFGYSACWLENDHIYAYRN